MREPFASAIAANRFGLGARPGELTSIGADGREWLRAQLRAAPAALADPQLRPSQEILAQALELRQEMRAARKPGAGDGAAAALQKLPQFLRPIYLSEASARFREAVSTDRPLIERLTQFWSNHFAVSVDKELLTGLAGSFEREAIRPHVLGNFSDLLLAVETHPAMLLYLDNHLSAGPHSEGALRLERRAQPRRIGINENLAREILELHTLGVGGGYTQADVTTFAAVITGWSIGGEGGPFAGGAPGKFLFRPELHEPGAKRVLGTRYADGGYGQGVAVLRDLAGHRATARFIATKLARHFIADDPPPQGLARLPLAVPGRRGRPPPRASSRPSSRVISSPTIRRRRRSRGSRSRLRAAAAICPRSIARSSTRAKPGGNRSPRTRRRRINSSRAFADSRCRWMRGRRHWRRTRCWVREPGRRDRLRVGRIAAPTGMAPPRS